MGTNTFEYWEKKKKEKKPLDFKVILFVQALREQGLLKDRAEQDNPVWIEYFESVVIDVWLKIQNR